jgi:DNA-binding MarR family transcriptional regulator
MLKAYLLTEVLRATGEREFPLQLASTFFWIAAHDGCRQEDLVNATSMSSSSVSRNVSWLGPRHRLGKDGLKLVIREKDPRDPKRYRLFLTPKGKQLSSLIQNTLDKWVVKASQPGDKLLITPGLIVGLGKSQLKQLKKELNASLNFVVVRFHSGKWARLGGGMNW